LQIQYRFGLQNEVGKGLKLITTNYILTPPLRHNLLTVVLIAAIKLGVGSLESAAMEDYFEDRDYTDIDDQLMHVRST
jgi:hypothetical protein